VLSRIVLIAVTAVTVLADVRNCICDTGSPSAAAVSGCSLCLEADKHPASETIILVRDKDPLKPNRWLALPRARYDGANFLAQMAPAERLLLWNTAIGKAKEVWRDEWGIAMNGDVARRQCHAHVHIGKLIEPENDRGIYVDGPESLPVPADEAGYWFHPVGNRLHVHSGEQNNERTLLK